MADFHRLGSQVNLVHCLEDGLPAQPLDVSAQDNLGLPVPDEECEGDIIAFQRWGVWNEPPFLGEAAPEAIEEVLDSVARGRDCPDLQFVWAASATPHWPGVE